MIKAPSPATDTSRLRVVFAHLHCTCYSDPSSGLLPFYLPMGDKHERTMRETPPIHFQAFNDWMHFQRKSLRLEALCTKCQMKAFLKEAHSPFRITMFIPPPALFSAVPRTLRRVTVCTLAWRKQRDAEDDTTSMWGQGLKGRQTEVLRKGGSKEAPTVCFGHRWPEGRRWQLRCGCRNWSHVQDTLLEYHIHQLKERKEKDSLLSSTCSSGSADAPRSARVISDLNACWIFWHREGGNWWPWVNYDANQLQGQKQNNTH